jgi:hypothetical protein
MTECACPIAGWCERHKMTKTRSWHRLCQENVDYRRAWDKGTGPGQVQAGGEAEARRERIKKRVEANKRLMDWIVFLRKEGEEGAGDTVVRLIEECGKEKKFLKGTLKATLSTCSCTRENAIKRLNSEHPYTVYTEVQSG